MYTCVKIGYISETEPGEAIIFFVKNTDLQRTRL